MTKSAADIVVPTKATTLFEDLEALVKASGPNKHDQAINLITVLIEAGCDTRSHIMEPATRLGFKHSHIGFILDDELDSRWRRDAAGIYTVI